MVNVAKENDNIRVSLLSKEKEASSLQANMEKLESDKTVLSENLSQAEKRLSDLTAQKELFTTVIESLTKKGGEAGIDNKEESVKE